MRWEPVRFWIYGLLGPMAAIAVAYGWVTDEQSVLWLALATAVLGVIGAEGARSKVTPWDDVVLTVDHDQEPSMPGLDSAVVAGPASPLPTGTSVAAGEQVLDEVLPR